MLHTNRGYTLYELLITVGIAAVLLGVATPSFSNMFAKSRQTIEINALFHAIHLARKESIMRRTVVSLCPSRTGQTCDGSKNWSHGWIMFENSDRDSPPVVDAGEAVLQTHAVAEQVRIESNRKGFTLRATFLRATNGTFIVCDRENRVAAKGLIVSYTGRPRVAFERRDGTPYSCAK